MSILRNTGNSNSFRRSPARPEANDGISVKCPRCQSVILCSGLHGDEPVRCSKCNYPLVCRSDLLLLINACKRIKNAHQVNCAVSVLLRLSEFMPEAATALGMLPTLSTFTIPLSERDRWNMLSGAYIAGDDSAQEGLQLMRHSNPGLYAYRNCSNCGAPKYYERHSRVKTLCPYCMNADCFD